MLMSVIMGDENSSTTLIMMNARVLHYTYDKGSLLFKNIVVLLLRNKYKCDSFLYTYCPLYFYH